MVTLIALSTLPIGISLIMIEKRRNQFELYYNPDVVNQATVRQQFNRKDLRERESKYCAN